MAAVLGLSPEKVDEVLAAAHHTAVLLSPSMSLVVNLLFKLVRLTAESLKGKGFDAEIVERHHRFKKDSPSGTAAPGASVPVRCGLRRAHRPSAAPGRRTRRRRRRPSRCRCRHRW